MISHIKILNIKMFFKLKIFESGGQQAVFIVNILVKKHVSLSFSYVKRIHNGKYALLQ